MQKFFVEKRRRLPVSGAYGVVVAGAGIAGISAAVSASRSGGRVCLVEKETSPGGLATLGLIAIYLPLCDGDGHKVIAGIAEELLKLSLKYGPGEIPPCWRKKSSVEDRKKSRYRAVFNPASFAISLEEFLLDNGIDILYDTRLSSCIARRGRLEAIVVENKGGRSAVTAEAFVDATGDADLCFLAGERTVSLDTNMKSAWYLLYDRGELVLKIPGPNSGEKPAADEETFSGVNPDDVSKFCVESRKIVLSDLKQTAKNSTGAYPAAIPAIPQFRMTRRLRGLYELDESEERRFFEDSVCMTGDWRKPGRVFYIPLGCLTGRTKNLFAAGRCISVTESMWDITRAIPACAATGEAAGAAAALLANGRTRTESLDVGFLQKTLKGQGVLIDPRFSNK